MDGTLRLEIATEAMRLNMGQFIDVELDKRKAEMKAMAARVVANFDFEGEIRQTFERAARDRIFQRLSVEVGQAAHAIMNEFDVRIVVAPKAKAPAPAQEDGK